MKLGRRTDYHGSRTYARDLPPSESGGWVARLAGRLAAWAQRKLDWLLRSGAEQASETIWLVRGEERHFSILGAKRDSRRDRAGAPPWPVEEDEGRVRLPPTGR